jgi:hypothetical protein
VNLLSILELIVAVVAGGLINWYFARRGSNELKREAERLHRLTLTLTQILAGQGLIEVKEWDPETGEPTRWSVGASIESSYNIESPTPPTPWWRRWFS